MTYAEDIAARLARCPDCDSENQLTQDTRGVWHLVVRHDATCPTYRALRACPPASAS